MKRCFSSLLGLPLLVLSVFSATVAADNPVTVRVGVYENAPKIFTNDQGNVSGFWPDIIEYIASQEGWKIEYVHGSWTECLQRLANNEIDIMPDVAYTTARSTLYSFPKESGYTSWSTVYAREGSKLQSILDLEGKNVAVLQGSVNVVGQGGIKELVEDFDVNCTFTAVDSYDRVFGLVQKGEADAGVTNKDFGYQHSRDYGLAETPIIFQPSYLYFALPKDGSLTPYLSDKIDSYLTTLKENRDSIYYQSLRKWMQQIYGNGFEIPRWLLWALIGVGGLVVVLAGGSLILRSQVRSRTKALTEEIIERKRTEEARRESERKYRELVELANSIILRWTRDGRVIFLNEFGQRFFGYTQAEIYGRHVIGTIVPETETGSRDLHTLMEEIGANPTAFEQNVNENIRRNGERAWIAWTNKVVLDSQGQVAEILSVGIDITARRQATEELRAAHASLEQRVSERTAELAVARDRAEAADRTKSAFLATMSHELRTPLNSIIGFTGILLQGLAGQLNEEQNKQLRMVQGSSRHLLALINDVLDISKIEAGQFEVRRDSFDPRQSIETVTRTVTPIARQKGLALHVEIAGDVGQMVNDQRRFEQVLMNLLSNAVKFTERGEIRVTCLRRDEHIVTSVRDTGMGIAADDIAKLFRPFQQIDTGLARQHEGTGLGLSISKRLVELMGGSITVESEPGSGSVFTYRLPTSEGSST